MSILDSSNQCQKCKGLCQINQHSLFPLIVASADDLFTSEK